MRSGTTAARQRRRRKIHRGWCAARPTAVTIMGCNPSKDGSAVGGSRGVAGGDGGGGGGGGGGVADKSSSAAGSGAAETLLIPLSDGKWTTPIRGKRQKYCKRFCPVYRYNIIYLMIYYVIRSWDLPPPRTDIVKYIYRRDTYIS